MGVLELEVSGTLSAEEVFWILKGPGGRATPIAAATTATPSASIEVECASAPLTKLANIFPTFCVRNRGGDLYEQEVPVS